MLTKTAGQLLLTLFAHSFLQSICSISVYPVYLRALKEDQFLLLNLTKLNCAYYIFVPTPKKLDFFTKLKTTSNRLLYLCTLTVINIDENCKNADII